MKDKQTLFDMLRKSSDTTSALFAKGGLVVGFIIFLLRKRSNKIEYMPVVVEVMTEDVYS